jgi:putative transposase
VTQSLDTKRFRVVGVLVVDADDYHLYITDLAVYTAGVTI